MKKLLTILLLVLAVSCSHEPDAENHLAPALGEVVIEAQCYSAHATCAVSNAGGIETATAVLESGGATVEMPAVLAGGRLSVDMDRLQSGSIYSLCFVVSSGEYSKSTDAMQFTTPPGARAIYPEDRVFEEYLLENHDTNHDGVLTVDEARRITSIEIRTNNISSIDEIRYMPNLFYLDVWNSYEEPGGLTHLDLSGNPNLIRLNCDWNSIEALDLTMCPYLECLCCAQNSLTQIDLSHNPELREINLDNNLLSSIDISHQTKLTCLNINMNRAIRTISIPNPEILTNFTIGDTRITEFDLGTMPRLQVYGGNNLPIDFVPDLSSHPHMTEIHLCTTGGASWIDDPHYPCQFEDLEGVNLCAYPLETIDFSKNTKLRALWISIANRLEEIDLSAAPDMEIIEFADCERLKRIYVHPNVVIENLKTLRGSCQAEILHKQ